MSDKAKCEHCGKESEDVKERSSMTSYDWDGKGEDPNRAGELCDGCAEDYRAYWQERWDEYYSSVL